MTTTLIIRMALLAMEKGLPLVLTIMEKDLNMKVEDMTTEEMVEALGKIKISDTDELIRRGQQLPLPDDSVPF